MQPIREFVYERLPVSIYASNDAMGQAAAARARSIIAAAIRERGHANIIIATGNSQLSFLQTLRGFTDISWQQVRMFHMDEYIGIAPDHPASFVNFLHQHIVDAVPVGEFFGISGQPDRVEFECARYEALLKQYPADMVAMGIGENGHLAFNDPPYADFNDPAWVKVVELADASRRQQVGEGHFPTLDSVPARAITLTIPALLAAKQVLCIVPEARKAQAVNRALSGTIDERCPASILRTVAHAHLYLDTDSAAGLT